MKIRPDRDRLSGEQGFTLLETLISVVILAFALAAIYQSFSTGFRGIDQASRYQKATLYAQSKLAAAGVVYPLTTYNRTEELPGGYEAEIDIRPEVAGAGAAQRAAVNLYSVRVAVRWFSPNAGQIELSGVKAATKP